MRTETALDGISAKAIKVMNQSELQNRNSALDNATALQERADMYASLGALLHSPATSEYLDILKNLPELEAPETAIELAWSLLRQSAHDHTVEQIDDEYHDLFIGIGRGEVVPYGSWHLTGFLMEKPLGLLRADLRRLGFERIEGVSESEDHIASVCEVMSQLIVDNEFSAEVEQSFFNDHVAPWAGQFFSELQNASKASFYRSVGQLGDSFLSVEKQYLSMSV